MAGESTTVVDNVPPGADSRMAVGLRKRLLTQRRSQWRLRGRVATTASTARRHTGSPSNWEGDHHGNSEWSRRQPCAVEQGQLTGQKPPLKLPEIWAIRTRLQMSSNIRELAMFNLAIDSKLRACDLTRLQVQDVCQGAHVGSRAMVMQQKTQRPVQFEITEQTRHSLEAWIRARD
jgi:hypothetical protein